MTPAELIDEAKKLGITHIAITDHDTISGIEEAINRSKEINGPEVIPAIEFSCHHKGEDIHILVYYISLGNSLLCEFLKSKYIKREERFREVVAKLSNLGFPIDPDEVKAYGPGGMKMSPQIVKALFDKKVIKDVNGAKKFVKDYLMPGKKAYVKHGDNPEEIINFFHSFGNVTSLAHPNKIHAFSIIDDVVAMGIDGLEVYYPNMNDPKKEKIVNKIKENNLISTGGSDFHGFYSDNKLGDVNVPEIVLSELKRASETIRKV